MSLSPAIAPPPPPMEMLDVSAELAKKYSNDDLRAALLLQPLAQEAVKSGTLPDWDILSSPAAWTFEQHTAVEVFSCAAYSQLADEFRPLRKAAALQTVFSVMRMALRALGETRGGVA